MVLYDTKSKKTHEGHGGNNFIKPLDLQWQNRAMTLSLEKPRAKGNMHIFVAFRVDAVNKQLVSSLN